MLDGEDLCNRPLLERKRRLRAIMPHARVQSRLLFVDHVARRGRICSVLPVNAISKVSSGSGRVGRAPLMVLQPPGVKIKNLSARRWTGGGSCLNAAASGTHFVGATTARRCSNSGCNALDRRATRVSTTEYRQRRAHPPANVRIRRAASLSSRVKSAATARP